MRVALLLFFAAILANAANSQDKILHCGYLLDVDTKSVNPQQSIHIEDGVIIAVTKGFSEAKNGEEIIDLSKQYVMPGLMDMHVHLEGEMNKESYRKKFTRNPADIAYESIQYAKTTLMLGFTTVRDVGGTGVNISLRNAIAKGELVGPRVFTSGKAIAVTGGHADPTNGYRADLMGDPGPKQGVVNGIEDCRKAVRQRYKNGADLIKITATGGVLSEAKDGTGPHFSEEEMKMIVQTANDLDMHVAAHAHGDEGMQRAVRAGVKSIEHGTLMSEETMELMIEKGTWLVPTITAGWSVADSAKKKNYFPDIITPKALALGPKLQETFGKAYKKGVPIAFGTDAGVFSHGRNNLEFRYMKAAGMKEWDILRSTTINAAQLLGQQETLGQLKKGYKADVVATLADPTTDIQALLNITFIMKEGQVYKQ